MHALNFNPTNKPQGNDGHVSRAYCKQILNDRIEIERKPVSHCHGYTLKLIVRVGWVLFAKTSSRSFVFIFPFTSVL